MNKKLGLLAVAILSVSLLGSTYAHKGQVVGDYKIDAGWKNEPPISGKSNAIEVIITKASTSEKKTDARKDTHDTKTKKDDHNDDDHTKAKAKKSTHEEKSKKSHDDDSKKKSKTKKITNGVPGLSKNIEVDVTLNGQKTFLTLKEDPKIKGVYHGEYTPSVSGHPTVHIAGTIKGVDIEATFHPEKVEEPKK